MANFRFDESAKSTDWKPSIPQQHANHIAKLTVSKPENQNGQSALGISDLPLRGYLVQGLLAYSGSASAGSLATSGSVCMASTWTSTNMRASSHPALKAGETLRSYKYVGL